MSIISWIISQRDEYVKRGGEIISEEWENARAEVCEGCNFNGMVSPDGVLPKSEGCTSCQCPFSTKRVMYEHFRKKGKEDEELTPSEVIEINTLRKINPNGFVTVVTKCSHPDGNLWESVDNHFKNL